MKSPNTTKLQNDINIVFKEINIWFEANLLSMNLNKTTTDICIKYNYKHISNITNTKFLGLFINDIVSWKTHIIPKLSSACFAMRSVKPCVSQT